MNPASHILSYPEDYFLFSLLVANELCDVSDLWALAALQSKHKCELKKLIAEPSKFGSRLNDELKSTVNKKSKKKIAESYPRLKGAILDGRELLGREGSVEGGGENCTEKNQPIGIDTLSPLIEELRDKRVQIGELNKNLHEWENSAIMFLEVIEALESNTEINDTWRKAGESIRKQFLRIFNGLGLNIILPERGDMFDETQHVIEGVEDEYIDLPPNRIVRCTGWGFKAPTGKVVKAQVIISEAEKEQA